MTHGHHLSDALQCRVLLSVKRKRILHHHPAVMDGPPLYHPGTSRCRTVDGPLPPTSCICTNRLSIVLEAR